MSELSAFEPDLVLMDVQLRDYSGVTLARLIRYEPRWLGLPIVYLSSEDNPENQLDALSKGADEFLVKPVTDDYLVRSVRIRCYRARQLSDLMNRDSLTGLLKHSLIKQEVDRELARCRRAGHTSCVVMLDLDHFKRVNDTWGHGQGDIVIRTLANLLRNRLRESDVIGRYGGEEFLLILPDCEPAVAVKLIEAIGKSFAELVFWAGDDSFQVTLSAGVALINDFPVSDQAIEAADQALYQRKRGGRNGVSLYHPSLRGIKV
jgi:diguanylate cyclase (GGDEF)-like protein